MFKLSKRERIWVVFWIAWAPVWLGLINGISRVTGGRVSQDMATLLITWVCVPPIIGVLVWWVNKGE